MDDDLNYSYIERGGFLIVCGGTSEGNTEKKQVLGVTREQARLLLQNCPFFEKCLSSDTTDTDETNASESAIVMKEAQDRIVHKPDWSLAIARHFVEVVTKGKTAVPTLEIYEQLMAAGDQALVDFRLSSLVNYMDACSKDHEFLRLVEPNSYRFRFQANVNGDQWLQLLEQNVLLYREETNYVVQLYRGEEYPQGLDADQVASRRKLDTRRSVFLVHADRSVDAILKIQQCLENGSIAELSKRKTTVEAFSIYFETRDPIPKDHHQLIDRLAGGEAYIRTCADAVEHQTEGYTVKASLDVLLRAIRPVEERSAIHCTFRVDNPTPDTLSRFINACQRAKAHPGTLGLDANINRYFCRKTMSDIKIVLEYMADYSTSAVIEGDFQLLELSSEKEAF
jgi:hypothetical protein